jgi:hypothetical protein
VIALDLPAMLSRIVLLSVIAFCSTGRAMGESRHQSVLIDLDLCRSCCDWEAGFADYPAGQESFHELTWGCVNEGTNQNPGLFISGSNRSDDLFMFIKHPIHSLKPLTPYRVEACVQFLSKAPTGCAGIGGDPGASVFVKFGASQEEPSPVVEDGMVRMNVDVGYQANGGANAVVIGDVATTITDCHNEQYELKELETTTPLIIWSDPNGTLWIFLGTDSGFEGTTSLIFTKVSVRIERCKGWQSQWPEDSYPEAPLMRN